MDFLMMDPKMDEHPDVMEAGFAAASVFQGILRVIARWDGKGRLRSKFASARWLARTLNIETDDIGGTLPEEWVSRAIQRCVLHGLLERDGDDLVVPGWERFYRSPRQANAERQQRWRDRQQLEKEAAEASTKPDEEALRVTAVTRVTTNNVTQQNSTQLNSTEPLPPRPSVRISNGSAPPKPEVVEEAREFGSWWDRQREAQGIPPECPDERKLVEFYAKAIALVGEDGLRTAVKAFLSDEAFSLQGYPFAIFSQPAVWQHRAGAGPPKKARPDPHGGIMGSDYVRGVCVDCAQPASHREFEDVLGMKGPEVWRCYGCSALRMRRATGVQEEAR